MRLTGTSYVAARPRDVFAVVGDPKRLGEWVDSVVTVEEQPGVGEGRELPGAFRVTGRVDDAPVVAEGHTTVWGPQHRVGFEFTSSVGRWELDYMIRPAGTSTRLDVVMVTERASLVQRLLMRARARHARREFAAALGRLSALIEMDAGGSGRPDTA